MIRAPVFPLAPNISLLRDGEYTDQEQGCQDNLIEQRVHRGDRLARMGEENTRGPAIAAAREVVDGVEMVNHGGEHDIHDRGSGKGPSHLRQRVRDDLLP